MTPNSRLRACCLFLSTTLSCVPWTVVPIEESAAPFSAKSYVDAIWDRQVIPTVLEGATADGPLVKGRGRVQSVNTESRSGSLTLELADGSQVRLLIGPVILGTALRDAMAFIEFSQFTNQLDYAAVANALNDRVVKDVVAPIDLSALEGRTLSFHGARTPGTNDIVPVRMEVE